MKRQTSTSKLQRSTRNQALIGVSRAPKYPATANSAWMLNDAPAKNGSSRHAFDLEERTARFSERTVFDVRCLELLWSLVLGIWSFDAEDLWMLGLDARCFLI